MSLLDGFDSFMKDVMEVFVTNPGVRNALDGSSGAVTETLVRSQPCGDQDIAFRMRGEALIDGIAGSEQLSGAFTRWFPWPVPVAGGLVLVRVNGLFRPLLRQGAPIDLGGQRDVYFVQLGQAEQNR